MALGCTLIAILIVFALFLREHCNYIYKPTDKIKRPFYHQPKSTKNHNQSAARRKNNQSYMDTCWNEMLEDEKHNPH
ncbi:MAG: hypothetical protein J5986_11360 [Roseburia sp.]|nr:hypothetical protein [Roseburia sp.]